MAIVGYVSVLVIALLISMALCALSVSWLVASAHGAPYVPTRHNVVAQILKHAQLKKDQTFLELGCGDARIVRMAVERYRVRGIGVDITWLFLTWGKIKAFIQGIKDIELIHQNIYHTNKIRDADVIYMFLMPEMLKKVVPKLEKEMKKDVLVISHGFTIPKWQDALVHSIHNKPFDTFYYRPMRTKD